VVYRVTRTLKVNVVVEPVDGGRAMRIHPDYLLPAPDDTTAAATVAATASVAVPYLAPLDPGTVVTVAGPGWKQPAGQAVRRPARQRRRPAVHRQTRATTAATGGCAGPGSPSSTRPASP